jgi:hypothetical protein
MLSYALVFLLGYLAGVATLIAFFARDGLYKSIEHPERQRLVLATDPAKESRSVRIDA